MSDTPSGDLNYDGKVNLSDFPILARHFGVSLSPAVLAQLSPSDQNAVEEIMAQVPEPAITSVLVIAGAVLPWMRRKT